ncbi:MAG: hypothetical protein Q8O16_02575 [Dehalococcoidia bacterium]|nr:hypothetical protein [Dehalococcoidia bacterium]
MLSRDNYLVNYLKRTERTDVYDDHTNFNPFAQFWAFRMRSPEYSEQGK